MSVLHEWHGGWAGVSLAARETGKQRERKHDHHKTQLWLSLCTSKLPLWKKSSSQTFVNVHCKVAPACLAPGDWLTDWLDGWMGRCLYFHQPTTYTRPSVAVITMFLCMCLCILYTQGNHVSYTVAMVMTRSTISCSLIFPSMFFLSSFGHSKVNLISHNTLHHLQVVANNSSTERENSLATIENCDGIIPWRCLPS